MSKSGISWVSFVACRNFPQMSSAPWKGITEAASRNEKATILINPNSPDAPVPINLTMPPGIPPAELSRYRRAASSESAGQDLFELLPNEASPFAAPLIGPGIAPRQC
jgi:hypothetical protein